MRRLSAPSLVQCCKAPFKLRKGMVLTLEPGPCYHGPAGHRFEDAVHVVPGGCGLSSGAPYQWETA